MKENPKNAQPIKEEDVLRRMLSTPRKPHKPKPEPKKRKTGAKAGK
jgi:hypothetical protein